MKNLTLTAIFGVVCSLGFAQTQKVNTTKKISITHQKSFNSSIVYNFEMKIVIFIYHQRILYPGSANVAVYASNLIMAYIFKLWHCRIFTLPLLLPDHTQMHNRFCSCRHIFCTHPLQFAVDILHTGKNIRTRHSYITKTASICTAPDAFLFNG